MMRLSLAALVLLAATNAASASRYDWDELGTEYCKYALMGDLAGLRPLLTASLAAEIASAARNPDLLTPRVLLQSYTNEASVCSAHTVNAALVEIRRSNPGKAGPAWSEYLVIVPEADGGSRIDDVLFATRRSDTLRARLAAYAAAGR
jgi:hypothetical protein